MDRVPEGSVKYILKANKDRMKRNSSKRRRDMGGKREREREDVGEVSKSNGNMAGKNSPPCWTSLHLTSLTCISLRA